MPEHVRLLSIAPLGRRGHSGSRGVQVLPDTLPAGAALPLAAFTCLARIGEGTYGVVFKARHSPSGAVVALKRIPTNKAAAEGLPISSMRELALLRGLSSPHVVRVFGVAVGSKLEDIYLVMEFCEQDLAKLMDTAIARGRSRVFKVSEAKCLALQLLRGVAHLHDSFIVHRDLKLSNILLTNKSILKLADFGLARKFSDPPEPITPHVVTLWYRSPELLLGADVYTTSVDMWSVGCIIGELLMSEPLLPGNTELKQLELICNLLGTPTPHIWPDMTSLPLCAKMKLPRIEYDSVRIRFREFSDTTQQLIKDLLIYRPYRRLSAHSAIRHGFFEEHPRACAPRMLPTYPEYQSEFRNSSTSEAIRFG